jgi:hypothetical protein
MRCFPRLVYILRCAKLSACQTARRSPSGSGCAECAPGTRKREEHGSTHVHSCPCSAITRTSGIPLCARRRALAKLKNSFPLAMLSKCWANVRARNDLGQGQYGTAYSTDTVASELAHGAEDEGALASEIHWDVSKAGWKCIFIRSNSRHLRFLDLTVKCGKLCLPS